MIKPYIAPGRRPCRCCGEQILTVPVEGKPVIIDAYEWADGPIGRAVALGFSERYGDRARWFHKARKPGEAIHRLHVCAVERSRAA
jgi:hypothetical protein